MDKEIAVVRAAASFPARLHVFLARDNPRMALVLRRGPNQQVAVIGWDRANDSFMLGQWLKGRIYEHECDLSPDGRHFLCAAMSRDARRRWTALSRAPYLTALDLSFNAPWETGGGMFLSDKVYWLKGHSRLCMEFKRSRLEPVIKHCAALGLECWNGLYLHRLKRDGWQPQDKSGDGGGQVFSRAVNARWRLLKRVSLWQIKPQPGKAAISETHQLMDERSGETVDFPHWEWADVDGRRIVFAEKGRLCALTLTEDTPDFAASTVLRDFTPMVFTARRAPYYVPQSARSIRR